MNNNILPKLCSVILIFALSMSNTILQWNCRGLNANIEELSLLIDEHKPVALCLQETFLKEESTFNLRYHSCYRKAAHAGERACGGVAILVNNSIPHEPVPLQTSLQATAVKITLNKTITLCSVYLPPSMPLSSDGLQELVAQLPKPFLMVGDFNAHNTLWGCGDTDRKGRQLEEFISEQDLCICNDKSHTYLHPATGTYSALDLAICSPDLFLDFNWKVCDDLHGSDHFPIVISETGPSVQERPRRWKLHKADWNLFQIRCEQSITPDAFSDCDDPTELFTSLVYAAAKEAILKPRQIQSTQTNLGLMTTVKRLLVIARRLSRLLVRDRLVKTMLDSK